MVVGLDSFREWFRGYEKYYAVIGGAACDLLLSEAGGEFRATRDIDMVLIVEAVDARFGSRFWEYVKSAGYEQRFKSTGEPVYYRFTNPASAQYPAAIELFSRRVDGIALPPDAALTPLPIGDDISSLSAILLDSEYYDYLQTGIVIIDGIPVLDAAHLIPFKAKAWLNLSERKASGGQVDSKDIRKHKNDVNRLSVLLIPDVIIELPDTIKNDVRDFLLKNEEPDKFVRVMAAYGLSDTFL